MPRLILASSSVYRQAMLSRLKIPFECVSPSIDESVNNNQTPEQTVKRLSIEKANVVAEKFPKKFVLGSDQIAVFKGKVIGKPHNLENAKLQLSQFSGQTIEFLTGVALVNIEQQYIDYDLSKVTVNFRQLTKQQIANYLDIDQPFDCAGSFKVEKYGISLFESINSDDPTSLEGLPLIKVCTLLQKVGILS